MGLPHGTATFLVTGLEGSTRRWEAHPAGMPAAATWWRRGGRPAVGWGAAAVSGLPGGAVTFLFTDIEGSTRLVKALREEYGPVLAEHRRLVRAAIAGQAGHEVGTEGDAFFVAFAGARQAVLCALEIQRALAGP